MDTPTDSGEQIDPTLWRALDAATHLVLTSEPYRLFYQSSRGLFVVALAGIWSSMGVFFLCYLHRQQSERRVLGGSAAIGVEAPL